MAHGRTTTCQISVGFLCCFTTDGSSTTVWQELPKGPKKDQGVVFHKSDLELFKACLAFMCLNRVHCAHVWLQEISFESVDLWPDVWATRHLNQWCFYIYGHACASLHTYTYMPEFHAFMHEKCLVEKNQ